MSNGYLFLDFEYNETNEEKLNLVCCSTSVVDKQGNVEDIDWWLHKEETSKTKLAAYLLGHKDKIVTAYNVEAEASSMISLGLDINDFEFLCLFLEYRCLQNHSAELLYGSQLLDGHVNYLNPSGGEKGRQNLAAATYKLLKVKIDTDHKNEMRDLIIYKPKTFTPDQQDAILKYCRSDVKYLPKLRNAIVAIYKKRLPSKELGSLKKEMLLRGNYAARTAKMVRYGYPVNVEWLHNFAANVPSVLETCQRDINSQFVGKEPFRWNKKDQRFSLNTQVVKDWVKAKHGDDWEKTETGQISLALESFTKKYSYTHDYPEGHLAAQMIRYLKLKQSMNGFNPNSDKSIFNDLGSDGRVRCYLNPYGAQSSRTQPASTSFMFLKPAWQRSMVQPPKGKLIGDYDWSSEEFLLSALCSGDLNMIEAYRSGDVYLAFGKKIGWIPQNGTKASHKKERDICKQVVLAMSYLMSKYGLSAALSDTTGRMWSLEEAQELIDLFDQTYSTFFEWRKNIVIDYEINGKIKLPCGWTMWGDNINKWGQIDFRSVSNMPLQGLGACIMREAIRLAQDAGLNVIFSLHDAIYIEFDEGDFKALDTLKNCMYEAFISFFDGEMKEHAKMIRVDGNVWGSSLEDGSMITPSGDKISCHKVFVDERATREYEKYNRYMKESLGEDLL